MWINSQSEFATLLCLVDKPTQKRTPSVYSTKNIAAMTESVRKQSSISTRHRSEKLEFL